MNAMERGNTCIDCHKGIAHKKVHDQLTDEEIEALEKPDPSLVRPLPVQWAALNEAPVTAAAPAAAEAAPAAQPEPAQTTDAAPAAAAPAMEAPTTTVAAAPAPEAAKPAATPAKAAPAKAAPSAGGINVDFSKAPSRVITIFYPGQASMEWVLNGRDHGGARPVKVGDRCFDCHDKEAADMGKKIVTGTKAEPNPIPGKRGSIPVTVRAVHDKDYLYMNFQWADGKHAPVPFADGGKMDPKNPIKLAVMIGTDDAEYAGQAGCWGTCHHDARTMPDAPDAAALGGGPKSINLADGVTKYLGGTRTEMEIKNSPRGGWNKLKSDDEIKAELSEGRFLDLLRYKSGTNESEDGYILAERVMKGGQGVEFSGELKDGHWSVTMKRKLQSDKPGDISIAAGQLYNIGFAIHDDYSNARYHHVSLGYKLGLDDSAAEINVVAK